jgi:hypothetical protein
MPLAAEAPWLEPEACRLVALLLERYREAFGRPLLAGLGPADGRSPRQRAQELFAAPLVLLAHDGLRDPCLTYANAAALGLWQRSWREMVGMPSRLTAPPSARQERAHALNQARQQVALQGYGGIRVSAQGRLFRITGARIWSVDGGQAACFDAWCWL